MSHHLKAQLTMEWPILTVIYQTLPCSCRSNSRLHSDFSFSGTAYIIGAKNKQFQSKQSESSIVLAIDIGTGASRRVADTLEPVNTAAVRLVGNKIVACGGWNGFKSTQICQMYDPTNNRYVSFNAIFEFEAIWSREFVFIFYPISIALTHSIF